MTYLITFICILIALAIFAGAFYLAKFVIRLTMRNELLEENYKLAAEHIAKQEEHIAYLTNENEHMTHEAKLNGERTPKVRSWEPKDMLNVSERS
jgi:ABC-type uncharacterized transport system fused permease/ATPase subunit